MSFRSLWNYKAVAQSTDRLDILGLGWVFFDFCPDSVDINHNGIFVNDSRSPYQVVDHILGKI